MRAPSILPAITFLAASALLSHAQQTPQVMPGVSPAVNDYLRAVQISAWEEAESMYPGGPAEMLFAPRLKVTWAKSKQAKEVKHSAEDTLNVGKNYAKEHFGESEIHLPKEESPKRSDSSVDDEMLVELSQAEVGQVISRLEKEQRDGQWTYAGLYTSLNVQNSDVDPALLHAVKLMQNRSVRVAQVYEDEIRMLRGWLLEQHRTIAKVSEHIGSLEEQVVSGAIEPAQYLEQIASLRAELDELIDNLDEGALEDPDLLLDPGLVLGGLATAGNSVLSKSFEKFARTHPAAGRAGVLKLDELLEQARRKFAQGVAPKSAFEIAQGGGKHAGFLKNYAGKPPSQIQKGINSLKKQIAEHQDKIANPSKHIPGFNKLDSRQQQALLNQKWPSDIARQQEQLGILEGLLGGGL